MAVNKAGLQSALESFFDPAQDLPESTGVASEHQSACAQLWADAMQTYVQAMEPLHLAALGTASSNLKTALEGVFATWYATSTYPSDNCGQINAAFDAFAAEIAASVGVESSDRTSGISRLFIGTPPPGIEFCDIPTISEDDSSPYASAAANVATLIDDWFTQGISDTTDDNPPMGKPHLTLPWR